MNLRRALSYGSLVVAFAAAGCGKKAETTAGGTSSDSLLASSPVEQPQGQIQPQTNFQPEQQAGQTQAPAAGTTKPPATTTTRPRTTRAPSSGGAAAAPGVTVPGGTSLTVTMSTALSSETAHEGDAWSGTIKDAVVVGSAAPFPAGSTVHGVVAGAKPAQKGDRAVLVLRVTSIEANGKTHEIAATADSLIAGSTRGRNVGAIAGGAAAGALIGRAVGGSGKGALIGGLLGGAAATGAVAGSKGYQSTVKEGADLVFHVDHDTRIRL